MEIKENKFICPSDVKDGKLINKNLRLELYGNVCGGSSSKLPENFQRKKIEEGTNILCQKTNMRINLRTYNLENISKPNILQNGFDYSEDFDGLQIIEEKYIYINLKCIVGRGGSQTRSLREVYWFIEGQINYIKKNINNNIYFANILDGDEPYRCMDKFNYLISLEEQEEIKNKIYIGDLKKYFIWLNKIIQN